MTGFRRLGSPLYSLPICGGFRIRLRGDLQIVRHYRLRGTGLDFRHFRKVHGQPPFPLFTMFVQLLTNSSLNVPSKSRTLFLIGSGVGNFSRCWRLRRASGAAPVLEPAGSE